MATNRYWKPGDRIRIHYAHGETVIYAVDRRMADDLNAGENPCYPWRVKRFERLPAKAERED